MFLRSRFFLGLLGLALVISATTVFAVSFSNEASAKKFRLSFSKSKSSSISRAARNSRRDDEDEKNTAQSASSDEKVAAENQEEASGSAKPKDIFAANIEVKKERAPNPLAAAHPGMDVIVCEAGCTNKNEVQEAVYMQPATVKVAELQPSAAGQENQSNDGEILCMGGCYDTPKVYRSAVPNASLSGEWKTNVVPTSAAPKTGSGEWMRRIDASQKSSQPAIINEPEKAKPAPPAKVQTN